jgi:hypothetical protein
MRTLAFTAVAAALACALLAPDPAEAQATKSREERAKDGMQFKPALTREQAAEMAKLTNKAELAKSKQRALPCPALPSAPIGFSVYGTWRGSSGADSLVPYTHVITNEGSRWFALPFPNLPGFFLGCRGLWFFTVSFVRDAWIGPPLCAGGPGTADDISIYLTRYLNGNLTVVPGAAWAGEGDGTRATAAYSVVLRLTVDEGVVPFVHSDTGSPRCLAAYYFSGFRISP